MQMNIYLVIVLSITWGNLVKANDEEIVPNWVKRAEDMYWITSNAKTPDTYRLVKISDQKIVKDIAYLLSNSESSNDLKRTLLDRGDQTAGWLIVKNGNQHWAIHVAPSMDRNSAVLASVKYFGEKILKISEKSLVEGIKFDGDLRSILKNMPLPDGSDVDENIKIEIE